MNLQDIEHAILAMNPAAFQELGDLFMISRNRDYEAFVCTGSQFGKQKTTKGTPDTLILTYDGKYLMIEYSTNETKKEKKLIDDFEKCITEKAIEKSKIECIILFTNYKLNQEEVLAIKKYADEACTSCEIYDGSRLARELYIHHKDLVFRYLGIHVDTGQIVSMDTFIQEYDNALGSIAAPLSNKFLYREQEIINIKTALDENDFILLHGAPGVGKTKLAIHAITEYYNDHPDYHLYCISYKGGELLTDLTCNINLNNNNIVFVDDINRISSFKSIVGFYSSIRRGKLKIVMTVRDYALVQAKAMCYPHNCFESQVNPMTPDQVSEIVRLGYGIKNERYLERIRTISKGNPRIAMMAGKLALQEQNLQSLNDVSALFDAYYGNIINNIQYKDNTILKKCVGIIAFFSPLKFEENEEFLRIIKKFGINHSEFTECIDVLNKHEIIDLPQGIYAKISEQNLCMYLFYLAFIKEKVLSIGVLFEGFYAMYYQRFRDCIIPVSNTFGPNAIEKAVSPDLLLFYNTVPDTKIRYLLLSDFWPYLLNETLAYISDTVYSIPSCSSQDFCFEKNESDLNYNNADILELSSKLFIFVGNELRSAIELAFEYVRRVPSFASYLLHYINEKFMYRHYDNDCLYYRQLELLYYVVEQVERGDTLCQQIIWYIAKLFLAFSVNYSAPGIQRNTIRFYQFNVPAQEPIFTIRRKIWLIIVQHFSFEQFSWLINGYISSSMGTDNKLSKYDYPYILEIINKHMNPKSLEDCLCVQDYIRWAKRNGMEKKDYHFFYKKYRCREYKFYVLLTWNRLRDKDQFDYTNYDSYFKYKQLELKTNFVFKTRKGYNQFLVKYASLINNKSIENKHDIINSLNYIVNLAFENSFDMGCFFLRRIIQYNFQDFLPIALFANHLTSATKAKKILSIIKSLDYNMKSKWIIKYFEYIPVAFLLKEDIPSLLNAVNQCPQGTSIYLSNLEKLTELDTSIIDNILNRVLSLNDKGKSIILDDLDTGFIKSCHSNDLIQKTYLQQVMLKKYYDYELEGLLHILNNNPHFLVDYIRIVVNGKNEPDSNLSQIWKVKGIEPVVEEVLKYLRSMNEYRVFGKHKWEIAIFQNIKSEVELHNAKAFLEGQFKQALGDEQSVEQIILSTRGIFEDLYVKFISEYINFIDTSDDFFRIDWLGLRSGFSIYGENTTFGDVEAAKWSGLLSCLNDIKNPKIFAIRANVNRRIVYCQKRADDERARNQLWR